MVACLRQNLQFVPMSIHLCSHVTPFRPSSSAYSIKLTPPITPSRYTVGTNGRRQFVSVAFYSRTLIGVDLNYDYHHKGLLASSKPSRNGHITSSPLFTPSMSSPIIRTWSNYEYVGPHLPSGSLVGVPFRFNFAVSSALGNSVRNQTHSLAGFTNTLKRR